MSDDYERFLKRANNTCAFDVLDRLGVVTGGLVSGRDLYEHLGGQAEDLQVDAGELTRSSGGAGVAHLQSAARGGEAGNAYGGGHYLSRRCAQFLDDYFIVVVTSEKGGVFGAGHYHLMRGGEWREDGCRKLTAHLLEYGDLRDVEVK